MCFRQKKEKKKNTNVYNFGYFADVFLYAFRGKRNSKIKEGGMCELSKIKKQKLKSLQRKKTNTQTNKKGRKVLKDIIDFGTKYAIWKEIGNENARYQWFGFSKPLKKRDYSRFSMIETSYFWNNNDITFNDKILNDIYLHLKDYPIRYYKKNPHTGKKMIVKDLTQHIRKQHQQLKKKFVSIFLFFFFFV